MNMTKNIKNKTFPNLAILGGQPKFQNVVHVGKPNLGNRRMFLESVNEILDTGRLTNDGPFVRRFEKTLQEYLGVKCCIAVNNATIGLQIAAMSLEISGEVILPSYTFIASAHALLLQGLKPVFVDIDRNTHNIDPNKIEEKISRHTSAILGVHLWGRACDVDSINAIAKRHDLRIIYDAAHALGASSNGIKIGNFGDCEVFSLHATKFINSFEGGIIATNDENLGKKLKLIRNFGFSGFDQVDLLGTNGKMPEVSAAMGLAVFDSMAEIVEKNKSNYRKYVDELRNVECMKIMRYSEENSSNYQYIVLEIDEKSCPLSRDEIITVLHSENILARKYFWPGCHRMAPYCNWKIDTVGLADTESVAGRVVVLPTGNSVELSDVKMICDVLKSCVSSSLEIREVLNQRPGQR